MKFANLILFILPTLAFAQKKDEQEIMKVIDQQTKCWNKGNVDSFMVGYWESDSLMYVGGTGVTYGYKDALKRFKNKYTDTTTMGKLKSEILAVKKLSSEYYLVVGKWFLRKSTADASGVFSMLFRKIKGKWVIVADHSS